MISDQRGYHYYVEEGSNLKRSWFLKDIFIWGGIIFFVASFFLLYLFQSLQYTKLSYQLQAQKLQLEHLRRENRLLDLERSNLASLNRIERIARDDLGMINPHQIEYIVYHSKGGSMEAISLVDEKRVDERIRNYVSNWLENISRVEAGTLFD